MVVGTQLPLRNTLRAAEEAVLKHHCTGMNRRSARLVMGRGRSSDPGPLDMQDAESPMLIRRGVGEARVSAIRLSIAAHMLPKLVVFSLVPIKPRGNMLGRILCTYWFDCNEEGAKVRQY